MTDTLIYMASAFALKKLEKAGVISTSGLKKYKIKKYENTYFVPIAYVGLLSLEKYDNETYGGGRYRGDIDFDTAIGKATVDVYMHIHVDRERAGSGWWDETTSEMYNRSSNPDDIEAQTYMQNYKLREENSRNIQHVTVDGYVTFSVKTDIGTKEAYRASAPDFASVEEFLDWAEGKASEGYGELTILVRDMAETVAEYNRMGEYLPDAIDIDTPIGAIHMKEYYGDYSGDISTVNAENIKLDFSARISPRHNTDEEYDAFLISEIRNRSTVPESYEVYCKGTISDYNTNVNQNIGTNDKDKWVRRFGGEGDYGHQGALTLEDAKAIVIANAQECYDEFQAFSESNRNYIEQRNGRGHQRTTVNTEPWDYNFGDTWDDMYYDEFQNKELSDRIEDDVKNILEEDASWIRVRGNGDGTYHLEGSIDKLYFAKLFSTSSPSEIKTYILDNPQEYIDQIKDAIITMLRSNGYDVSDVELSVSSDKAIEDYPTVYFNMNVRPTVAKSDKMKKSIRKTFMNIVKSFKKN